MLPQLLSNLALYINLFGHMGVGQFDLHGTEKRVHSKIEWGVCLIWGSIDWERTINSEPMVADDSSFAGVMHGGAAGVIFGVYSCFRHPLVSRVLLQGHPRSSTHPANDLST